MDNLLAESYMLRIQKHMHALILVLFAVYKTCNIINEYSLPYSLFLVLTVNNIYIHNVSSASPVILPLASISPYIKTCLRYLYPVILVPPTIFLTLQKLFALGG
jgi:hypothetical protein